MDYQGEGTAAAPQGATTTSTGEPSILYQPATTLPLSPDAPATPKVNLDEFEEFRKWKSNADRRVNEAQRQAQEAQARLAEYENQRRAQELENRLRNGQTEEVLNELLQEQAVEAVRSEEIERLQGWDQYYIEEQGVPPQVLDMVSQAANGYAVRPSTGEWDPEMFHMIRSLMLDIARANGAGASPQQQPQQQQQFPQSRYVPPAQPAARPAMGAAPTANPRAAFNEAMSTNTAENWQRVRRMYNLR